VKKISSAYSNYFIFLIKSLKPTIDSQNRKLQSKFQKLLQSQLFIQVSVCLTFYENQEAILLLLLQSLFCVSTLSDDLFYFLKMMV